MNQFLPIDNRLGLILNYLIKEYVKLFKYIQKHVQQTIIAQVISSIAIVFHCDV